jgi:hypothetical protein
LALAQQLKAAEQEVQHHKEELSAKDMLLSEKDALIVYYQSILAKGE